VIVRYEAWGAWVKLESTAALVALDRDGVRALGLDGGRAWTDPSRVALPIEVHIAVTARCGAGCKGCYLDARPDGEAPPRETIEASLEALARAGVFTVAFGGGEPTTREDLGEIALSARSRGLTPVVTTSGIGLTPERIASLRGFEQVNVSYDGPADVYAGVRGFDGAGAAERAIERLSSAGVRVGVNLVLTRASFPRLEETVARARALGACEVQLLRYKPAGRAASLDYLADRLTRDQRDSFGATLRRLASTHCTDGSFHVRIDCALTPFLANDEVAADPARLARFGVLGCEAARSLAAITVDGRVAPCSFAPPSELRATNLARSYGADASLERWRTSANDPAEPCASCPIREVCKGGCKVVSTFLTGAAGPDPECPRVERQRGAPA
jgi:radical SAM protein with 4Fe4S-binding SPASM domain